MDNTGAVAPVANEVTYLCGGEAYPTFLAQNLTAGRVPAIFPSSSNFLSTCSSCCAISSDYLSIFVACGQHNGIKPQDPIRCRSCGYRILYKVRTKRSKY